MNSRTKKVVSKALDVLYPKRCPSCGELVCLGERFCESCRWDVPKISRPVCEKCGLSKRDCICQRVSPLVEHVVAPYVYDGTIRDMLLEFKFGDRTDYKAIFAQQMAEAVFACYGDVRFDVITCVPMTDTDLELRGYNQSALLARELCKHIPCPFAPDGLIKCQQTRKQHELTAAERIDNLHGCFAANPDRVKDKTVLLCDDIKTTGATLHECCEALFNAGARDVYCVCASISGAFAE